VREPQLPAKFRRAMTKFLSILLLAAAFCVAPEVHGHQTSDSYLALSLTNQQFRGRWAIALRDLDHVLTVDADKDGEVSDAELSNARPKVEGYAFDRLKVVVDGEVVQAQVNGFEIEEHSDVVYATLLFAMTLKKSPIDVAVTYTLFNDTDPLHRGLFRLDLPKTTGTAIFSPAQPTQRFLIQAPQVGNRVLNFVGEGTWHIWIGFDHILFLIALLLPSVLIRQAGVWVPTISGRAALLNIVKVVTAFTVAHSITLTVAALGWVQLPSRLVESIIAASVVVAALNNIKPLFAERTWLIAFAFGLIHGFGFASALSGLKLDTGSLIEALVGFNVGVELGQLAIVAVFVPIAFAARKAIFYRDVVVRYGSILIAVLAAAWFVERAFAVKILPI
jgi:hypothetical protein